LSRDLPPRIGVQVYDFGAMYTRKSTGKKQAVRVTRSRVGLQVTAAPAHLVTATSAQTTKSVSWVLVAQETPSAPYSLQRWRLHIECRSLDMCLAVADILANLAMFLGCLSLFSSSSPSVDRSVGQVFEGGSGSNSTALFTSPSVDRLGWIGLNISKPKPILFAFYNPF
jgi:hypothetical protein